MACAGPSRADVTVAVIDDHEVVHAGIEAWCASADPPIHVGGGFATPEAYFDSVAGTGGFDVVVFDIEMEGRRPAFDALSMLCQQGQRVIVYSHMTADEVILTCLDIGAVTYLAKSEGRAHLLDAIRESNAPAPYVGPRMGRALLNDSTLGRISLSERERQVLVAWFQTESKELVGERLNIATATVRTHLQRARAKYASVGRPAPTKSALLARAIDDGLLSLGDL